MSEIEFSLVKCMFRIRKGRSNHAEEAEEKAEALFKRFSSEEDNRLNCAHFGLFLHSHSKKHENRDCLLYNK